MTRKEIEDILQTEDPMKIKELYVADKNLVRKLHAVQFYEMLLADYLERKIPQPFTEAFDVTHEAFHLTEALLYDAIRELKN